MDKYHTISNELLTTISLTSVILPLYGYADECRQLMSQLRSKSRKMWVNDMSKWFRVLSKVKRTMKIDTDHDNKFEMLKQNYLYAMLKLEIDVNNKEDFNKLANFLKELSNIKLIEITRINLDTFLRKIDIKPHVVEILEFIGQEKEVKEFNAWYKVEFISIPPPFQFTDVSHVIDKSGKYIIDSRISELPEGFEMSKNKEEILNDQVSEIECQFQVLK